MNRNSNQEVQEVNKGGNASKTSVCEGPSSALLTQIKSVKNVLEVHDLPELLHVASQIQNGDVELILHKNGVGRICHQSIEKPLVVFTGDFRIGNPENNAYNVLRDVMNVAGMHMQVMSEMDTKKTITQPWTRAWIENRVKFASHF